MGRGILKLKHPKGREAMKRNGEDIIVLNTGEIKAANTEAMRVSKSRNHSWCHVWYIDSQSKKLTRHTFCEGRSFGLDTPGNFWFSTGKRKGLTILDAMHRYTQNDWIKTQAKRLGATGEYRDM